MGRIAPQLGRLTALRTLSLSGNQLTGPIPAELGSLAALDHLSLDGNQLSGPIPAALGSLGNLELLWLQRNRLSGVIAPDLRALRTLRHLRLDDNQLSGAIPATLGALHALETLSLRGNQFRGAIPVQLAALSQLEHLDLGGNAALTGCIPPALHDVPSNDLAQLGLPDCGSSTAPPPATDPPCRNGIAVANPAANPGLVADCVALLTVKATLAGDAPLNWDPAIPITHWDGVTVDGAPSRVRQLSLPERGLTGHIPPKLADLSNLEVLRLDGNQLTGAIPPCAGRDAQSGGVGARE